MYSINFPDIGVVEFDLNHIEYEEAHNWANYPKGVLSVLQQKGYDITQGFDAVFYGNIPNGAGLSSSASIELVTAVMVNDLFGFDIEPLTLVQAAQQAENTFVGVNCGIMDQFSIGFGKENHAILLNCKTLKYTYSPMELGALSLVIANTNKQRGLADSKYNERRGECEQALKDLQQIHKIDHLCDLSLEDFEKSKYLIEDPIHRKRAQHVISENERTVMASELLKLGDIQAFGQLMNESHQSLKENYEVTGVELDALVEAAWEEGAVGARMTGAGFGGCTVNLIETEKMDAFMTKVAKRYEQTTGLSPAFYPVAIGDGAKKLSE